MGVAALQWLSARLVPPAEPETQACSLPAPPVFYCHVVAAKECFLYNFISQVEQAVYLVVTGQPISLSVSDLALRISYLGFKSDVPQHILQLFLLGISMTSNSPHLPISHVVSISVSYAAPCNVSAPTPRKPTLSTS